MSRFVAIHVTIGVAIETRTANERTNSGKTAERLNTQCRVFLDAYERSVQRYQAVMTSIGPPNRLKLKYRLEIKDLVQSIIIDALPKAPAETRITEFTKANIPEADQSEFERLALPEVYSVHEGNYARFKVRPSEFQRVGSRFGRILTREANLVSATPPFKGWQEVRRMFFKEGEVVGNNGGLKAFMERVSL